MEKKLEDGMDFVGRAEASCDDVESFAPAYMMKWESYTDRTHFIDELILNAEDACAEKIRFVEYNDRLEFCHDGKPFTERDLTRLLNSLLSARVALSCGTENSGKGFYEGFLSVFTVCKDMRLYSNPQNFRDQNSLDDAEPFAINMSILAGVKPVDPDGIPEEEYTTKFVFYFIGGESYIGFRTREEFTEKIESKIKKIDIPALLFLKSIKSFEYEVIMPSSESGIKVPTRAQDGFTLVKRKVDTGKPGEECVRVDKITDPLDSGVTFINNAPSYLVFSKECSDCDGLNAPCTVDIAFGFKEKNLEWQFVSPRWSQHYVSVILPTSSPCKLGFIVRGPFKTTPGSNALIYDDPFNEGLAELIAELYKESVVAIKRMGLYNYSFVTEIMPLETEKFYRVPDESNVANPERGSSPIPISIFTCVYDANIELFKNERLLPCKYHGQAKATEALLVKDWDLIEAFSDEDISSLIGSGEKHWLNIDLEKSKERGIYNYLHSALGIEVVGPQILTEYLRDNESFLKGKAEDYEWLEKFYRCLSGQPGLFSKRNFRVSMLTVPFVKTMSGKMTAPYKRVKGSGYVPNIFVPVGGFDCSDQGIEFVDLKLYKACRDFFDNVLGLKPFNGRKLHDDSAGR